MYSSSNRFSASKLVFVYASLILRKQFCKQVFLNIYFYFMHSNLVRNFIPFAIFADIRSMIITPADPVAWKKNRLPDNAWYDNPMSEFFTFDSQQQDIYLRYSDKFKWNPRIRNRQDTYFFCFFLNFLKPSHKTLRRFELLEKILNNLHECDNKIAPSYILFLNDLKLSQLDLRQQQFLIFS